MEVRGKLHAPAVLPQRYLSVPIGQVPVGAQGRPARWRRREKLPSTPATGKSNMLTITELPRFLNFILFSWLWGDNYFSRLKPSDYFWVHCTSLNMLGPCSSRARAILTEARLTSASCKCAEPEREVAGFLLLSTFPSHDG
jgi:hypothetical protein